jgi:hypothetical protein
VTLLLVLPINFNLLNYLNVLASDSHDLMWFLIRNSPYISFKGLLYPYGQISIS